MSYPPPVIDHAAAAIDRLAQWAKSRPNVVGFLNAVNVSAQRLETVFQDLIVKRTLDNATAAQLDTIGDIVGQKRGGDNDTVYRQRIRARIKLNRSSGTAPEILAVMRLALISVSPIANSIWLHTVDRASFELTIQERQTADLAAVMLSFLTQAHAGGVRAQFEWWQSEPSEMFRLDAGPGLDQGHLAGAALAK